MRFISFRRILYIFGFVGLFSFTAYLAQDDWFQRQQTRHLTQETARLKSSLDTIEQKHQRIIQDLEKEKGNFKSALDRLQKENEELRHIVDRLHDQTRQISDEKSYLEEILITKTKETDRLKKAPGSSGSAWSGDTAGLMEQLQAKDKELRTLEEQNRLLAEKLEKLYRTTTDKIGEINVAKIALEDTVAAARQKINDEWNTVNLGAISASGNPDAPREPAGRQSPSRVPRAEGKVLAVNDEHGFVVIDLGRVDNLKTEDQLDVRQNGQTVATLSVLEIRDVMAACNIREIASGGKIKIDDPVAVHPAAAPPNGTAVPQPVF